MQIESGRVHAHIYMIGNDIVPRHPILTSHGPLLWRRAGGQFCPCFYICTVQSSIAMMDFIFSVSMAQVCNRGNSIHPEVNDKETSKS